MKIKSVLEVWVGVIMPQSSGFDIRNNDEKRTVVGLARANVGWIL